MANSLPQICYLRYITFLQSNYELEHFIPSNRFSLMDIVAKKVWAYPSEAAPIGTFTFLLTNIRIGYECLQETNTLPYYIVERMTYCCSEVFVRLHQQAPQMMQDLWNISFFVFDTTLRHSRNISMMRFVQNALHMSQHFITLSTIKDARYFGWGSVISCEFAE